jgi:hypothetical protein
VKDNRYLLFVFTSIVAQLATKRLSFRSRGMRSNNLYLPSLQRESSIFYLFNRKLDDYILKLYEEINIKNSCIISTQSATDLEIKENSIDYIFTDPPFGHNIMYSEISYLWESWLKVFTNNNDEAIINKYQKKELSDYKTLMTNSFSEMYKIIKPNRWMTVVFHNSKAKVWNAIQEAITKAGFIIAQVSILDKKQGSYVQISSAGSVKNDLVINAYKPEKEFEDKFLKNAGEGLEADFVKEQLKHLPTLSAFFPFFFSVHPILQFPGSY